MSPRGVKTVISRQCISKDQIASSLTNGTAGWGARGEGGWREEPTTRSVTEQFITSLDPTVKSHEHVLCPSGCATPGWRRHVFAQSICDGMQFRLVPVAQQTAEHFKGVVFSWSSELCSLNLICQDYGVASPRRQQSAKIKFLSRSVDSHSFHTISCLTKCPVLSRGVR